MLIYLSKRGIRRLVMSALPGLVILAAATWFWNRWAGWAPAPDPWEAGRLEPNVSWELGRDWNAMALVGSPPLDVEEHDRFRADLTGDSEPETVIVEAVYTNQYAGQRLGYYRVKVENGVTVLPDESDEGAPTEDGSDVKPKMYVLESPLWEGSAAERGSRGDGGDGDGDVHSEMLAGAYGAPFSVKAINMTGDGLRELVVLGKAGQKNTPFYIFRWDGESYVSVLSELFWGNPRLIDLDHNGTLEIEGYHRVVSESALLRRYGWRDGRWMALSGVPILTGTGGDLVTAVLDGISQAFLEMPLPNPTRWFAQEWIEDPNGWMAWRDESASWAAVQVQSVDFLTPESNERAGTWKVLGWIYEVLDSGGQIERIPVLLTFEIVREAGEWRIRDIWREDPQDDL